MPTSSSDLFDKNELLAQSLKVKENLNNLVLYITNNHREFYIKENYELKDILSVAVFAVWFVVFLCLIANCLLCCNFIGVCCSEDKDFEDHVSLAADLRHSSALRNPVSRESGESR
jgi:hypothetical protein